MTDQPLDSEQSEPAEVESDTSAETPPTSRFPELDELQNDVSRRIRDNKKFLDRFMDEEFVDDDPETTGDEDDAAEDFEEL